MVKILVLDGHPDSQQGLCHALAAAYAAGARDVGHEVRFIRLADAQFGFLRSAAEFATPPADSSIITAQSDIDWANHIVLVFPLWLGSAPAYVRAFFEQAARGDYFSSTDVSGRRRPRLKGKSARLIVTMGMPSTLYRLAFGAHGVRSIARSILGFAGASPVRTTLIGGAEAPAAVQKRRLAHIRALGTRGG